MQQETIITLDQNTNVFLNGIVVGLGEMTWKEILRQVPLSRVEHVIVRDESNPFAASEWRFPAPFGFESLDDAIEWFPPTVYAVDSDAEETELRESERKFNAPSPVTSAVESTVHAIQERENAPEVEEIEEEDVEEEEIVPREKLEPLPDAEFVEWGAKVDIPKEETPLKNDFDFKPIQESRNFSGLPRGVASGQIYLPGERLNMQPFEVKRRKLVVNKQKSKVPYYTAGILVLLVLLVLLVKWIATPDPTQYQTVCVDLRTHLVAESQYCEKKTENYGVGYALQTEMQDKRTQDAIPPSTVFKEPKGNVEIKKTF